MKNRSRYLATFLIVFAAVGVLAFSPCAQAQSNQATIEGQKAIIEGAKQMMAGNKRIMAIMAKKGMKDADLTAAEKQMTDGYELVTKGNGMMAGSTMAQGQEMMKRGAKMMLEAQKATRVMVEKKGMLKECAIDLHECHNAEQKIEHGSLQWYFGGGGI